MASKSRTPSREFEERIERTVHEGAVHQSVAPPGEPAVRSTVGEFVPTNGHPVNVPASDPGSAP